jgi:hypothetical protein
MNGNAAEIRASGKLGRPGDLFAGPTSNAKLRGGKLTATTGLDPRGRYTRVNIPKAAESSFKKVTPIGPYTSWQRFMRHRVGPRGYVNLKTGQVTRTGVNWSQVKNYGADVVIDTLVGGIGYATYKNLFEE